MNLLITKAKMKLTLLLQHVGIIIMYGVRLINYTCVVIKAIIAYINSSQLKVSQTC